MQIDPVLIIVIIGSVGGLLIERFFYYKSKYKQKNNTKIEVGNPINLDRFYQAFKDFKEMQMKWNDRIQGEINELEKMRHPGK